jgi:hypothetical protein
LHKNGTPSSRAAPVTASGVKRFDYLTLENKSAVGAFFKRCAVKMTAFRPANSLANTHVKISFVLTSRRAAAKD